MSRDEARDGAQDGTQDEAHAEARPHARIVRMANQIGTFFLSKPHDEGVAGVAEHINRFWEPRMRRQFFAALEGGEEFLPIVREAAPGVRKPDQKA